ncbi:hydantoinase B/oxoprolinase family protein [Sinorhizobium prairiense]|uniref:hydantoinase B/oxoprolinase family protein n=1 Tax=unclassified Sinorhizobium TaxID=2613772 RepID=UPI0023D8C1D4|nr:MULTISPECIES: hydantoinase B/oxoprolinase family protein [unclassified Sinorhizobium]WEJ08606.1 hydantoinase B/oxoprolinase family protein [Sinorhizobium sp. M103]WEJ13893.1 hydantoinase B/oxoprolinase family protein [Sinorhizobium sp. K101]WEJ35491.1 hydantoinase B/oxoprolinase family protein [Sinorhizobium sp. C101]
MDIARTEIMKNRFSAIAEEAATLAYRTAHTTFVKQTQDFQVALARTSGEFFAFPLLSGTTDNAGDSIIGLIEHFSDLVPGDVVISNDPFSSRGLVTHQMDIHMAQPVFYRGELIAFAWSFVHATDIGGAVPTSISPELNECFQEGFRIRPTKLMWAGELNHDVANFIKDNSRIGEEVWGDLEAMMAAMRLLERRVGELCERVGIDAFRRGIDDVLDYAETKARQVIAGLHDGEYGFSDYLEGLTVNESIHIHCQLRIRGEEAEIDFAGSDPQVNAALNFNSGGLAHSMLCGALVNYIMTMEPSIPPNGGVMRPIRAHAPSGTVMNAEFPAAMGNRWVTAMRCYDALMGCLNQAIPGGITAGGAGQAGIISVAWKDTAGRKRVSVVEPFSGGSGGRVSADGVDATDTMLGFLKSTPIESVESETPLLVRQHALVPSSHGHGQYRGGASVCIELECLIDQAEINVRGLQRQRFEPWAVLGGHPGRSGEAWLLRAGEEKALGQVGLLKVQRGDVLRMISPSGGGFGDPAKRTVALVVEDVTNGMLDEQEAAKIYGVIIRDGVLDVAATERRRAETPPTEAPLFVYGHARGEYEAHWSAEASAAFANAVLQAPSGLRAAIQREARLALDATPGPVEAATVSDTVAKLIRQMQASTA